MNVVFGSQEYFFTTSGATQTFIVPFGVYWLWVTAVAGGAGGGTSVNGFPHASGGGGAGESVNGQIIPATPGGSISVVVGGGGDRGRKATSTNNIHAGPEGNTNSAFSGDGGEDTSIGPIKLKGGFAGIGGAAQGHGGMGGGVAAGPTGGSGGGSGSNCGDQVPGTGTGNPGSTADRKGSSKYWSGGGGGAGALATLGNPSLPGGNGGSCGTWTGGTGGAAGSTNASGGGGGGASIFGRGGDGGAGNADAGAPAAGAYGAGGGGGGGDTANSHGTGNEAWKGTAGNNGYVLLDWVAIT